MLHRWEYGDAVVDLVELCENRLARPLCVTGDAIAARFDSGPTDQGAKKFAGVWGVNFACILNAEMAMC